MALPFPILPNQTDAKSPIDQHLMDSIRLDLDDLDTRVENLAGNQGGSGVINFKVNGPLKVIRRGLDKGFGKKLDGAIVSNPLKFSRANLFLEQGGTSGKLEVDVKRWKSLRLPIDEIAAQFKDTTQSIGRVGSSLATQAIDLATPNIDTQSITYAKGQLGIVSISDMGDNKFLYTFSGTTELDSDYSQGDYIKFNGCVDSNNDGEFQILNVNYNGLPSVLVENSNGVEQNVVGGNGQLSLYEFTYLASVDSQFSPGEVVIMSGHTNVANDGQKLIYKINEGGNNILCKYPGGEEQASAAGQAQVTRFKYTFSSAPDDTLFIIGEKAEFSGHTSAANDGKLELKEVSTASSQVIVSNVNGVAQAGAAGNMDSLHWSYATSQDSSNDIAVGDSVEFSGHDDANNDGTFIIQKVNRNATNNLEVYNENGATQSGANGDIITVKKVVWFLDDYATNFEVDKSLITLAHLEESLAPISEYMVKEINRGGFTNYNVVIEAEGLPLQDTRTGIVETEGRTIFDVRPSLEVAQPGINKRMQFSTNATFLNNGEVEGDIMLTMDILELQEGSPMGLTLSLS